MRYINCTSAAGLLLNHWPTALEVSLQKSSYTPGPQELLMPLTLIDAIDVEVERATGFSHQPYVIALLHLDDKECKMITETVEDIMRRVSLC